MPLHKDLEYEYLHYTHPRHTLPSGKELVVAHDVQYVIHGTLTLGEDSDIILSEKAELIII